MEHFTDLDIPEANLKLIEKWLSNVDQLNSQYPTMNAFLNGFDRYRTRYDSSIKATITDLRGGFNAKINIADSVYHGFAMMMAQGFLFNGRSYFQEVLRKDDTCRVYLDLDSDRKKIRDDTLEKICQMVIREYQIIYNVPTSEINPEMYRYLIIKSSEEPMRKVHIHFPGLITTKEILCMMMNNILRIRPNWRNFMDTNYSGCRIVYNYKFEKNSVYIPSASRNLPKMVSDIYRCRIRAFEWETTPKFNKAFDNFLIKTKSFKTLSCDTLTNERTEILLGEFSKLPNSSCFNPQIETSSLKLKRIAPSECPICSREHQSDGMTMFIKNDKVFLYCFRAQSSIMIKELDPKPVSDMSSEELEELIKSQEEEQSRRKEFLKSLKFDPYRIKDIDEYNSEVIHPLDINKKIQVIKSPMNTQKTRTLKAFIEANKQKFKSILFISPRRNFSRSLTGVIEDLTCYLDCEDSAKLSRMKRLVIQVESINKLTRMYDLVVMDESTSILSQMNSPLHGKFLTHNRYRFKDIIKNASNIVCMDADIDDRTITFLERFRPKDSIHLQINHYRPSNRNCFQHVKLNSFYKSLFGSIQQGLKVSVPCCSIKVANRMHEMLKTSFPNKNIRLYTSEEKDYPEEMANPNDPIIGWSQFDILIYTSTVNVGIDYNLEHFDKIYAYGSPRSVTWREFLQMIGRVRNLKQGEIHYFVSNYSKTNPLDFDTVMNQLIRKCNDQEKRALEIFSNFGDLIHTRISKHCRWRVNSDVWSSLKVYDLTERNLSEMYYKEMLILMFEDAGYTHQIVDEKLTKEQNSQLKMMSITADVIKEQERRTLLENASITKFEVKQAKLLVQNSDATKEDKMILVKNHLMNAIQEDKKQEVMNNGELLRIVETNYDKLKNIRLYFDSFSGEQLAKELICEIHNDKNIFMKLEAVQWLCSALELKNCIDTQTVINTNQLKEKLEFLRTGEAMLKNAFQLRSRASMKSLKSTIGIINSVFTSWCDHHFKGSESYKNNGVNIQDFSLIGPKIKFESTDPSGNNHVSKRTCIVNGKVIGSHAKCVELFTKEYTLGEFALYYIRCYTSNYLQRVAKLKTLKQENNLGKLNLHTKEFLM